MNTNNTYKNLLMIPIWPLYNMESLGDINYDENLSEYLKDGYELKGRNDIYNALKWAEANPNHNFIDIMKDSPKVKTIKFNNEEIYSHLLNFKIFMENEEFGLLTDSRPPKEL